MIAPPTLSTFRNDIERLRTAAGAAWRRPVRAGAHRRYRSVEPYRLVYTGHRWYLLGWDRDRGDWRTFRADRITPTGGLLTPIDEQHCILETAGTRCSAWWAT